MDESVYTLGFKDWNGVTGLMDTLNSFHVRRI